MRGEAIIPTIYLFVFNRVAKRHDDLAPSEPGGPHSRILRRMSLDRPPVGGTEAAATRRVRDPDCVVRYHGLVLTNPLVICTHSPLSWLYLLAG